MSEIDPYSTHEADELEVAAPPGGRPRLRPPVGIPVPPQNRLIGSVLSVALHAFIILLLVAPFAAEPILREIEGAGGPGPAGGGGGGRGGTGGYNARERLRYIQVAPPPAAKPAEAKVPTPVTPPVTPPVVPPPVPQPKVEPPQQVPQISSVEVKTDVPSRTDLNLSAGTGGGTGNDGTNGNGPGSGGGVGSGVGTGRGTGVGPGTGGGPGTVYPPTPTELFIPPLPVPDRVKGTQLVAVFDIDERGRVVNFTFNPTRDGGYNRKLREVLGSIRFRPAVRSDGTPVPAQGSVTYFF